MELIEEFDEWSEFWLKWWKPWEYTDVNNSRCVWTRWVGVPLHAWSDRFFGLGCARFGRMVSMHEVSKNKRKFDEAYIRISTGLQSVDHIMRCKIDGAEFQIRVEEV